MNNIYYNPEAYGLTVVGEVDPNEAYQFHTFVVWKDEAGKFYWASDVGCSCPTPFEDENLATVSKGNAEEASKAALEWASNEYRKDMLADIHTLIRKIRA